MSSRRPRPRWLPADWLPLGLLALLPVLAHAPGWWEGRLLGPGDGAALHYPLRSAVWESYRRGELPTWNPTIFTGTPLLAAYRPGALYPPMVALSLLPPFIGFQALVLASLSAAAVLTFLYLRRLGAGRVGAYVAGLSFGLGPYLLGHLGDTATVVAAPGLPLVLLAAESHMSRARRGRAAALSAALALLLLAGSPEAVRAAGLLLVGRLLVGHVFHPTRRGPTPRQSVLTLVVAVLLAAPQVLPTLLLAREAGRQVTGIASAPEAIPPGATGLVLRYVSHTPAPALAVAAVPLALTSVPVRVLGAGLALSVALQWGRGPLSAPGALPLAFDFTLAALGGISLSVQWRARRDPLGRRLRAWFLFSALASAAALSVAASALGPLDETLAGSVGVLALALILYFSLASSRHPLRAGLWLLPLTASFLLQPHGRRTWQDAPTSRELSSGTPTRQAVDAAMGRRRDERLITLVREWPREDILDLAYANLSALCGRTTANGYDPMVPLRTRLAFDGMGPAGTLPGAFLRTSPGRLEALGVRWVQVPARALSVAPDAWGLGDPLDMEIEAAAPRFLPVPITPATEIRLASFLSEAVDVPDGEPVARVDVRLASGRDFPLVIRAGKETAEWAYDRPDVRLRVAHDRPPILESWPTPGELFPGHRYYAVLRLPGRYYVDGVRVERIRGRGRFTLARLSLFDTLGGRPTPVSLSAAYVSDTGRFREAATTPGVRLFELPGSFSHARVASALRLLPDDEAVLRELRRGSGELRLTALAVKSEARGVALPEGSRAGRAEVERAMGSHLDVRAEGPGLLVLAEAWDPGWSATIDERPTRLLRVNHAQMALVLPSGAHRVSLSHHAAGFSGGLALAVVGVALLVFNRTPLPTPPPQGGRESVDPRTALQTAAGPLPRRGEGKR